jgi:hypothetical protein
MTYKYFRLGMPLILRLGVGALWQYTRPRDGGDLASGPGHPGYRDERAKGNRPRSKFCMYGRLTEE